MMFKPRGPQKPSRQQFHGITLPQLIKVLEFSRSRCIEGGDMNAAFRFEMLREYFEKDYDPGKPVKYSGEMLGF